MQQEVIQQPDIGNLRVSGFKSSNNETINGLYKPKEYYNGITSWKYKTYILYYSKT